MPMEESISRAASRIWPSGSITSTFRSGRRSSGSWTWVFSRSSVTWKALPCPGALATSIIPSIALTMCLVMVRPRPEPAAFRTRVESSRTKGSKIFSCSSGDIPAPLSFTTIWVRMYAPPLGDGS